MTIRCGQRSPSVKPNVEFTLHQRIGRKSRVLGSIRNNEQLSAHDRVCAECILARRLAKFQTDFRFEPLPVFVKQAYKGNGCRANRGCQPREIIEPVLRARVEDSVTAQGIQPLGLIFRYGIAHGNVLLLADCMPLLLGGMDRLPGSILLSIFLSISRPSARSGQRENLKITRNMILPTSDKEATRRH